LDLASRYEIYFGAFVSLSDYFIPRKEDDRLHEVYKVPDLYVRALLEDPYF
jgi:hypothetical protein